MNDVTILIPTLRRPESLARALRSVFAQHGARELIAQIVVVDNAPEGSARVALDALAPLSPAPLVYVHEPHPGVATARNAGLVASAAPYVAFIDDDETAPPEWLGQLRQTHLRFQADVTFGPVRGVTGERRPARRAYLDGFFSRVGPQASGLTDQTWGCGNSMMTRASALKGDQPFDPAADQTGGEDDRLFTELKQRGARFAWAAEAHVYEHAPAHRARLSYALTRAMGFGQSPSQICARAGDWPGVARWMLIGLGQVGVYGTLSVALWVLRRPSRYACADRAAQGLGKVLWTNFLKFYGAAEARRTAPRAASGARSGSISRTDRVANSTQIRSL